MQEFLRDNSAALAFMNMTGMMRHYKAFAVGLVL